ncbi:hypothetical protein F4810DRAFT_642507 [Camillea tinctor]|nr:hypothetical protein F4810DRAFT_642507 [Camillea tinctor]
MRLLHLFSFLLPVAVICQPVLEEFDTRATPVEIGGIAGLVTALAAWSTLGYTVYRKDGKKIIRFILRQNDSQEHDDIEAQRRRASEAVNNFVIFVQNNHDGRLTEEGVRQHARDAHIEQFEIEEIPDTTDSDSSDSESNSTSSGHEVWHQALEFQEG